MEGGAKRIPEVHWLASLAKSVNFRVGERDLVYDGLSVNVPHRLRYFNVWWERLRDVVLLEKVCQRG